MNTRLLKMTSSHEYVYYALCVDISMSIDHAGNRLRLCVFISILETLFYTVFVVRSYKVIQALILKCSLYSKFIKMLQQHPRHNYQKMAMCWREAVLGTICSFIEPTGTWAVGRTGILGPSVNLKDSKIQGGQKRVERSQRWSGDCQFHQSKHTWWQRDRVFLVQPASHPTDIIKINK